MAEVLPGVVEEKRDPVRKSPDRRAKSHQAARAKLLAAGATLLAHHGLEGANSNQIAKAAGVGVGTFYAHFEDKHALHRAIVGRAFEHLQARLAGAAAGATDLEDQVRALVAGLCDFAAEFPDFFRVAFGRPAPLARPGEPALTFSTRGVEQRLAELKRQGRLATGIDPAVAARGAFAMQTSVVLQWLDGKLAVDRGALVETLTRLHPALCAPSA